MISGLMVFCPKCGKANPEEATYCKSCGNPLPKTINTNNLTTAKNCPVCNKTISSENNFCPYCAADLRAQKAMPRQTSSTQGWTGTPQPSPPPYVTSTPAIIPRKSHTARNVGIGLILLIGIIAIVLVASGIFANNGNSGNGPFSPTQQTVNVVSGSVAVNALTHTDYSFTVPSGVSNPVLQGSFTASGGSGNDIKVYVMDQTDYVNWENGHQASTYYNSGQVTTGNIDVALSAGGTYYIVFDNTFSIFSSKTVSAQINLTYSG
jgi:endogenous inhibitor of DNA gyrase (YacG/DUF329 family)